MPAPLSLLEELARIPDPRSRRGIRHPLSAILGLTVLAMLTAGKRLFVPISSLTAGQIGKDGMFTLRWRLPKILWPKRFPMRLPEDCCLALPLQKIRLNSFRAWLGMRREPRTCSVVWYKSQATFPVT